jgi:hypothetical protein
MDCNGSGQRRKAQQKATRSAGLQKNEALRLSVKYEQLIRLFAEMDSKFASFGINFRRHCEIIINIAA